MPPSAPVTTTVLPLAAAAIRGAEENEDPERTENNTRKATPSKETFEKYNMSFIKQWMDPTVVAVATQDRLVTP